MKLKYRCMWCGVEGETEVSDGGAGQPFFDRMVKLLLSRASCSRCGSYQESQADRREELLRVMLMTLGRLNAQQVKEVERLSLGMLTNFVMAAERFYNRKLQDRTPKLLARMRKDPRATRLILEEFDKELRSNASDSVQHSRCSA